MGVTFKSEDLLFDFQQIGSSLGGEARLHYLPPITLQLILPHDYPLDAAPKLQLTAPWLSKEQVVSIDKALNEVAKESLGLSSCYSLVEWLECDLLRHLGIQDHFDISFQETRLTGKQQPYATGKD